MRKGKADIEPARLANLVSYRVRLVQIAAFKNFEAATHGFGSAPRYYGALSLIAANPGISQSRLAEAIYLDRSSLVAILETLAREGLIERRTSQADRRVRQVFLTDVGAKVLEQLDDLVAAHEARMVDGMTEAERAVLLTLLRRIDENLHDDGSDRKGPVTTTRETAR